MPICKLTPSYFQTHTHTLGTPMWPFLHTPFCPPSECDTLPSFSGSQPSETPVTGLSHSPVAPQATLKHGVGELLICFLYYSKRTGPPLCTLLYPPQACCSSHVNAQDGRQMSSTSPEDQASRVGGGGRRGPLSPPPLNQRVCSKQ